jgi:hypothetical protein
MSAARFINLPVMIVTGYRFSKKLWYSTFMLPHYWDPMLVQHPLHTVAIGGWYKHTNACVLPFHGSFCHLAWFNNLPVSAIWVGTALAYTNGESAIDRRRSCVVINPVTLSEVPTTSEFFSLPDRYNHPLRPRY